MNKPIRFKGIAPDFTQIIHTAHKDGRESRNEVVKEIGYGEVIDVFYWDKGHKNGPELHYITSNGIVVIINAKYQRYVTDLIARPGQIRRYYECANIKVPTAIVDIAYKHELAGLNNR